MDQTIIMYMKYIFQFLLKNKFLNINHMKHVLSTQFVINREGFFLILPNFVTQKASATLYFPCSGGSYDLKSFGR